MSQSLSCDFRNPISYSKSWNRNPNSRKFPEFGIVVKPRIRNVRVIAAADRRDNLDHLQKAAVKKRETPSAAPLGTGSWNRFPTTRSVQQMMDTMERMIEEPLAFTTTWASPPPAATNGGFGRGRTPWEIKESEAEYKIRFDMPGMNKKDVKVWVEEKMLAIKAEKVPRKKDKQENGGVVMEEEEGWPLKSFGKYSTRIALPENVEFEKIKAEVRDGVLYVTIPKASPSTKIFDISVE